MHTCVSTRDDESDSNSDAERVVVPIPLAVVTRITIMNALGYLAILLEREMAHSLEGLEASGRGLEFVAQELFESSHLPMCQCQCDERTLASPL